MSKPQALDAQLRKISDKLQYFQSAKQGDQVGDLIGRELWDLWEMLRLLTLRIRDLEQPKARAEKAAVQA